MLPLGHYVDSHFSVPKAPSPGLLQLERTQVACRFGLGADAVALVLVIGDAVHRKRWFVAMMSCRRATKRTRR
jgi:hypothetical protein